MSYKVEIVADSVGPNRARVTTFALQYPMKIHWDFMTHRALSRNASSGRAISVSRMIRWLRNDTFKPLVWLKDDTKMNHGGVLDEATSAQADKVWDEAFNLMVGKVKELEGLGVHRQEANGLLVPFGWMNVCVTSTTYDNYFTLRVDRKARPEIQKISVMMARAYRDSAPTPFEPGWWHLPFVTPSELSVLCELRTKSHESWTGTPMALYDEERRLLKLSTARCARVSYKTFGGKEPDPAEDVKLHDSLLANGHWPPFEHQAKSMQACKLFAPTRSGNFTGWIQYRQTLKKSVHESFDFAKLDEIDGDFSV